MPALLLRGLAIFGVGAAAGTIFGMKINDVAKYAGIAAVAYLVYKGTK